MGDRLGTPGAAGMALDTADVAYTQVESVESGLPGHLGL